MGDELAGAVDFGASVDGVIKDDENIDVGIFFGFLSGVRAE